MKREVIHIEILAQTEYQNLYRITDGVLLVVNKFVPMDFYVQTGRHGNMRIWLPDAKYKTYGKGCQKDLKELKEDYYDKYSTRTVKKGTVIYNSVPVTKVEKADWTYEIKTTGSSLGGNFEKVENMLNCISNLMRTGK